LRLSAHLWRLTTAWECLDVVAVQRQLRALDLLAAGSGTDKTALFRRVQAGLQALASADLAEADVMIGRTERIAERSQEPDTGAITQRDVDFLLTVASLVRTRRPEARLDEVVADGIGLLQPYAGRAVLNAGAVTFHGVVDDYLFQACRALSQPEATGVAGTWLSRVTSGSGRPGGGTG
jgi:hypothetical protein